MNKKILVFHDCETEVFTKMIEPLNQKNYDFNYVSSTFDFKDATEFAHQWDQHVKLIDQADLIIKINCFDFDLEDAILKKGVTNFREYFLPRLFNNVSLFQKIVNTKPQGKVFKQFIFLNIFQNHDLAAAKKSILYSSIESFYWSVKGEHLKNDCLKIYFTSMESDQLKLGHNLLTKIIS